MEFTVTIVENKPPLSRRRFNSMLQHVSAGKQERIKRMRSYRNAQNCLIGDILTRSEIYRITGTDNGQLVFTENEHGKPSIKNLPGFHYNISHSGHYIAFAADEEPVGVDIETYNRKYSVDKIAHRFFAPDEIEYVMNAAGKEQTKRFFKIWTMKEGRIKCDGKGLSMPLPSFSVLNNTDKTVKIYYHNVYQNEEAVCHVCAYNKQPPHVRIIGSLELEIK